MSNKQDINLKIQKPGFFNRVSDSFGNLASYAIYLLAGVIVLYMVLTKLGPTLKWLIPLLVIIACVTVALFWTTKLSDEKAREFFTYKATLSLVRIVVLLMFLFVTVR